MTLSTLSVVQLISQETSHKDNISDDSSSTSNNSSQAQEFNILDVLVNSPSLSTQSSKQGVSRPSVMRLYRGTWQSQFCQRFWNILQYLASC